VNTTLGRPVPKLHTHWANVIVRACPTLTATDKVLWQVLLELDDTRGGKPGGCFATEKKLAAEIGSPSTDVVRRSRVKLERCGLLVRQGEGRKARYFPRLPVEHEPPKGLARIARSEWIRAHVALLDDAVRAALKSGDDGQKVGGDPTNSPSEPDYLSEANPTNCRCGYLTNGSCPNGCTIPGNWNQGGSESLVVHHESTSRVSNSPDRSPVGSLPSVANVNGGKNGADAPLESRSPALSRGGIPEEGDAGIGDWRRVAEPHGYRGRQSRFDAAYSAVVEHRDASGKLMGHVAVPVARTGNDSAAGIEQARELLARGIRIAEVPDESEPF